MAYFFTADTHFGAQRTLEFSRRPFKNVDEMDHVMIENWNNTIKSTDTVIHLGDFGDFGNFKKLNGKIVLLFGNYERNEFLGKNNTTDKVIADLRKKFYEEYNVPIMINPTLLKMDNQLIHCEDGNAYTMLLSHEPQINSAPIKETRIINIFGHIHRLCMIKQYGLNVGVDCQDFKPVDMETIKFYTNAIANYYDENVFN